MKERIKRYLDALFAEVPDTRQLRELKEEIAANLLDRVNDAMAAGDNEDSAFSKAVASLGDMGELVASLKNAAADNAAHEIPPRPPLDRLHVFGYAAATVLFLLGFTIAGVMQVGYGSRLPVALRYFVPFFTLSVCGFLFLGLTQETRHHYGMNHKRALSYCLAASFLLLGLLTSGLDYAEWGRRISILNPFMPCLAIAAGISVYLGLTEKSRRKMDPRWQKHWAAYYANPRPAMIHGAISGALWILAIASFFLVALVWGWKFSWIPLVAAVALEALIAPLFALGKK